MHPFTLLPKDGDFSENLQAALDSGKRKIRIPAGEYLLKKAIRLPSGTYLSADRKAHIKTVAGFVGLFVFANADFEKGNENITISGGIWDGNCGEAPRASYCDTENPGLYFVFDNVKHLTLKNLEMKNAACYHIRLFKCVNFTIKNVAFTGELHPLCQDGVHVNGGCENGLIKNIYALGTGDDLIAINADEALFYGQGIGIENLPIRNITVKNVASENCWTGVRLLSVEQPIENIVLKNFRIGFHEYGINLDAARFAGDQIFNPADYPDGVGKIKNVRIQNFQCYNAGTKAQREAIILASNVENFGLKNFKRLKELEPKAADAPAMMICYLRDTRITGSLNLTVENQKNYLIEESKIDNIKVNCK